jgi:hypothetical protein
MVSNCLDTAYYKQLHFYSKKIFTKSVGQPGNSWIADETIFPGEAFRPLYCQASQ